MLSLLLAVCAAFVPTQQQVPRRAASQSAVGQHRASVRIAAIKHEQLASVLLRPSFRGTTPVQQRRAVALYAASEGSAPVSEGNKPNKDRQSWLQKVKAMTLLLWARILLLLRRSPKRSQEERKWTALFRTQQQQQQHQASTWRQALTRLLSRRSSWILGAMFVASARLLVLTSRTAKRVAAPVEVPLSQLLHVVQSQSLRQHLSPITVSNKGKIMYRLADKACYTRPVQGLPQTIIEALTKAGVEFGAAAAEGPSLAVMVAQIFPILWLGALMFMMKRNMGDSVGSAGKRANVAAIDTSLSFDDIAGIDDAKAEVQELVNILRDPAPYIAAGARLPSGVLLQGGPGTGKTRKSSVSNLLN